MPTSEKAQIVFHPKAYLVSIRNVRRGLASRSKILSVLETKGSTARLLSKRTKLNYAVVLHHLNLLTLEKIVMRRKEKKPYIWMLTGAGQQRLI
jgi:predicted transcriptional regulator